MTLFPDMNVDFSSINEMILLPIRSRLLRTGIELKVFDHLIRPMTSREISNSMSSHPENTVFLLDGLAATGLLEKMGGRYRNTPETNAFLVTDKDTYLGTLVEEYQRTSVEMLENLTEMVRDGPLSPPEEAHDPMRFERYTRALTNTARGGFAQLISRMARELPEFSRLSTLLDVGGGPGIIAMAILNDHPEMTGAVFEQSEMAREARGLIAEYGMAHRLEVIEGDFLTDEVDRGFDLVLTSFCLYFGRRHLDRTINKILSILEPGGVYLSIHEGLTDEGTRPEMMVLPHLALNMAGRPNAFHWGEIADSMRRCGFSSVESRPERSPFGDVELVIGKK